VKQSSSAESGQELVAKVVESPDEDEPTEVQDGLPFLREKEEANLASVRGCCLSICISWMQEGSSALLNRVVVSSTASLRVFRMCVWGGQVGERPMDYAQLCDVLLGRWGRRAYAVCLCVFCYGTLWAYASVFATAMGDDVPLPPGHEHQSYHFYLILFALVCVPLTCIELQDQVCGVEVAGRCHIVYLSIRDNRGLIRPGGRVASSLSLPPPRQQRA
jgi:hypothetical protein